jgi:hypothetical protein
VSPLLRINVHTNDRGIADDLIESKDGRLSKGDSKKELGENTELIYQGTKIQKLFGAAAIVELGLTMSGSVASSLIASYLYDRLKDREVLLEIDGERVEVDEESIQTKLDEFQE